MNLREFLLAQLAEECTEIAQRAIKCMRFGMNDVQAGQNKTNAERLFNEIVDQQVILDLLNEADVFSLEHWKEEDEGDHYTGKWLAVYEWAKFSHDKGTLSDSALAALQRMATGRGVYEEEP